MQLPKLVIRVFVLTAWIFLLAGAAAGQEAPSCIKNIELFLDTCPANDPALTVILDDFEIRRNGVVVENILCSEPVSAMSLEQYRDEVIVLQGLRVIYYMDSGRSGRCAADRVLASASSKQPSQRPLLRRPASYLGDT